MPRRVSACQAGATPGLRQSMRNTDTLAAVVSTRHHRGRPVNSGAGEGDEADCVVVDQDQAAPGLVILIVNYFLRFSFNASFISTPKAFH